MGTHTSWRGNCTHEGSQGVRPPAHAARSGPTSKKKKKTSPVDFQTPGQASTANRQLCARQRCHTAASAHGQITLAPDADLSVGGARARKTGALAMRKGSKVAPLPHRLGGGVQAQPLRAALATSECARPLGAISHTLGRKEPPGVRVMAAAGTVCDITEVFCLDARWMQNRCVDF